MAVTCRLAGVAYLALYEELAAVRSMRAAVEGRLEDLGQTTLDDLLETYRVYWRAKSDRRSVLFAESQILDPLDADHGALASWLIAPLRSSGDSTEFGNQVRNRAFALLEATAVKPDEMSTLKVAVASWTVGAPATASADSL